MPQLLAACQRVLASIEALKPAKGEDLSGIAKAESNWNFKRFHRIGAETQKDCLYEIYKIMHNSIMNSA